MSAKGDIMKKPVFTKVVQIGIVVCDLDKTVSAYADKYGIGPWSFYEQEDILSKCSAYGKSCEMRIKAACAFIDGLEFELIQPLDENNMYGKFLKEHGEGLHHLAFDTSDCDEAISFFEKEKIPFMFEGIFGGEEKFYYADTAKDLALIGEFYRRTPDVKYPDPTRVYPEK
jgi:hypothetical protein